MNFIALDYETANADQSSICQIGIAVVKGGAVDRVEAWITDPETEFDPINISIHGIDETTVSGAPKLKEKLPEIISLFSGQTIVSHSAFDRVATLRACEKLGLAQPDCIWMDSARIVRRAWPETFGKSGYGLKNVAKALGIDFEHHDAGEDARACAEAVLRAIEHSGIDLTGWQTRVNRPINPSASRTVEGFDDPNPEGPFFGATLVFTGALTLPRREAAVHAAAAGFTVGKNVTRKTNILIVGDQDVTKLAGKSRSSKHIKAEQLIQQGTPIEILSESDFRTLVETGSG